MSEPIMEYGFQDYLDMDAWNDFVEGFSDFMDRKNPECVEAIVTVRGFGWRNQNGHKVIDNTEPYTLLNKILPETDCAFKIFETDYGFDIQNFHHDSPTGKEWYEVTFLTDKEKYKALSELTGELVDDLIQMVEDGDGEWVSATEFHIYLDDSFYSKYEAVNIIDYFVG